MPAKLSAQLTSFLSGVFAPDGFSRYSDGNHHIIYYYGRRIASVTDGVLLIELTSEDRVLFIVFKQTFRLKPFSYNMLELIPDSNPRWVTGKEGGFFHGEPLLASKPGKNIVTMFKNNDENLMNVRSEDRLHCEIVVTEFYDPKYWQICLEAKRIKKLIVKSEKSCGITIYTHDGFTVSDMFWDDYVADYLTPFVDE